ncbi:hypothetical protein DH09_13220 [Bacillaceae bacterium JMAK1]|nr:hypothetical protein DH09_13220 [Bacillaceae bacterium JMAK1]
MEGSTIRRRIWAVVPIAVFLLIGCNQAEQQVQELSEDYEITMATEEATEEEREELLALEHEQIDHMLMYIRESLDEEEAESVSIPQSNSPHRLRASGTSSVELETQYDPDENDHPFHIKRHFSFAYELEESDVDLAVADDEELPSFVEIDQEASFITGMIPGLEWHELTAQVSPVGQQDSQELSFSTIGEWRGEFIYEDQKVVFSEEDEWAGIMSVEEWTQDQLSQF